MTTELFDSRMLDALQSAQVHEGDMAKEAFVPASAMGGGPAPAPGGAPPGGAPPGDPAAMMGMPPGDPAAMMGMPPGDPAAMMGMPPTAMDPTGMGGMPPPQPGTGSGGSKKLDPNTIYAILYEIKTMLIAISQHMAAPIPAKAMMGVPPDPMALAGSQQQFQQQDAQANAVLGALGATGAGGQAGPMTDPSMMDPAAATGAPKMASADDVVPLGTTFSGEGKGLDDLINEFLTELSPKVASTPATVTTPAAPPPSAAYQQQSDLATLLRRFTSGN